MITQGIIRNIKGSTVSVEVMAEGCPVTSTSCGTSETGCSGCSGSTAGQVFTASNRLNLNLKDGSMVEVELPTAKTISAVFRVLIMPLILFMAGYLLGESVFMWGEGLRLVSGFTGLAAGLGINILLASKNRESEMPTVSRLL